MAGAASLSFHINCDDWHPLIRFLKACCVRHSRLSHAPLTAYKRVSSQPPDSAVGSLQIVQLRRQEMDTAILSTSAGLIGSLVGGVSTFAASWITQHKVLGTQRRLVHARQRQKLYSEFIIEATKRLAEAWNHQAEGPEVVGNLYSAIQRMRLVSSDRVISCAEDVMRGVIAAYGEPNRTFDELKRRVQQRSDEEDHLRAFTEACRQELND
jgi:hypothetical protein